jgi:hypothetical protein
VDQALKEWFEKFACVINKSRNQQIAVAYRKD